MLRAALIACVVGAAAAFAPGAATARYVAPPRTPRCVRRAAAFRRRAPASAAMVHVRARAYMTAGRVQADAAQGHLLLPAVPPPGCGPPRGKASGPLGACGGGARILPAVSGESALHAEGWSRKRLRRATGAQRFDAAHA